ncbi:MAG: hypothetical protein N3B13_12380, partial [Deltaproteobacteria bacterium]|nr:hypothetical protein [Deltaproteobacteria bacterium]
MKFMFSSSVFLWLFLAQHPLYAADIDEINHLRTLFEKNFRDADIEFYSEREIHSVYNLRIRVKSEKEVLSLINQYKAL